MESLPERLRAGPAGAIVDWKAVDVLAPFGGARIEDDVHVVGGEAILRNLTREHLPIGGGRGEEASPPSPKLFSPPPHRAPARPSPPPRPARARAPGPSATPGPPQALGP